MAQHEASLRVKENIGFDLEEYDKRRKLQASEPTDKRLLYGGGWKTKPRLPEPKKLISTATTPKPEEPSLPTPPLNIKFLKQRHARIPELCPGVTVRGGANVPVMSILSDALDAESKSVSRYWRPSSVVQTVIQLAQPVQRGADHGGLGSPWFDVLDAGFAIR
jgi:hypothetical protein